MKKTICCLSMMAAAALSAATGVWSSRGDAVLDPAGVNPAGNPCVTVVGAGKGKGYGGLLLTLSEPLDLKGAGAGDSIRFKTYQNVNHLVVMLRGKGHQRHQGFRLPADGKEIVLPLDPAKWRASGKAQEDFGSYDEVVFYHSALKHPYQSLGITSLVIEKGGRKLYEYQSDNTLKVRTHQVVNLGRGGHNSAELLRWQLPKALKEKPSLAVIMVGTNDMNNPRKLQTLEQYEANLRKLTAALEKAGAKVMLITPPPCSEPVLCMRKGATKESVGNAAERIQHVCAVVSKVAAEKGYTLVDFYSIVAQKAPLESAESYLRNPVNSQSTDGVHPTREGYTALSKAILEAIRKNQLPTSKIVCLGDSITYGSAMVGAGTSYGQSYPAQLADLLNK